MGHSPKDAGLRLWQPLKSTSLLQKQEELRSARCALDVLNVAQHVITVAGDGAYVFRVFRLKRVTFLVRSMRSVVKEVRFTTACTVSCIAGIEKQASYPTTARNHTSMTTRVRGRLTTPSSREFSRGLPKGQPR